MFAVGLKQSSRTVALKRGFKSSAVRSNEIFGTPKSGVYSNLPFQVKNRKFIPFPVYYWSVLGFFFAFPFVSTWWQLKKSGSLDKRD